MRPHVTRRPTTAAGGNATCNGGNSQIVAENCPTITAANDSTKNGVISNTHPMRRHLHWTAPQWDCRNRHDQRKASDDSTSGLSISHLSVGSGRVRAGCSGGTIGYSGGNTGLYHRFRVGDFGLHDGQDVHHIFWFHRWRRGVAERDIFRDTLQRDCRDGLERKHLLFRQLGRVPGALACKCELHEPGTDFPGDCERPEYAANDSERDDVKRIPKRIGKI